MCGGIGNSEKISVNVLKVYGNMVDIYASFACIQGKVIKTSTETTVSIVAYAHLAIVRNTI